MLQSFQAMRVAAWVPIIGFLYYLQILLFKLVTAPWEFPQTLVRISTVIWSNYDYLFLTILFLRYFRLLVNIFGLYFLSQPDQIPKYPTVTSSMAHVIIPSVEPTNEDFYRCVLSVLEKRPGWITVVTANQNQSTQAQQVLETLPAQSHTQLAVTTGPMANKRHQLAHVLRQLAVDLKANKDVLVVFVDDHVWWPSPKFLSTILAPFENPKTGIVAMHKQPERNRGNSFADSLLNFIACLYLERHNFEIGASNAIDGSAFVVSGRTCAIRASIATRKDFIDGFVDEYFFFGRYGPLNPDDDNYITRYIVRNGWNIKWQNQPEALMETSLGVTGGYKKFNGQINRWARSQWRSNPCSVFTDRSIWRRGYIWGGLFFCASFFNFALVWDPLIVYLWYHSSYINFTVYHVAFLILGSKFIKVAPFFYRNPQDIWLFPFQVLFAYSHSFVKFWALLTFWDHSWSGRNLAAIQVQAAQDHVTDSNDHGHERRESRTNSPTPHTESDVLRKVWADGSAGSLRKSSRPVSRIDDISSNLTQYRSSPLKQSHLAPVNVMEGQYGLRNNANFHGTARTSSRLSSKESAPTSLTGYLGDTESSRSRSFSDEAINSDEARHTQAVPSIHSQNGCLLSSVDGYVPARTHFTAPVPAPPSRNSIMFIRDSPFPSSLSPIGRVNRRQPQATSATKLHFPRDDPRGRKSYRQHANSATGTTRRSHI